MIELANKRDQDYVLSVIANWEESDVSPTLVLMIGDEDWSDYIPDGDYSQDSISITLEATFADHLPLRLYGAPISLSVSIGGVLVPCLKGLVSLPEPNDDMVTTKLMAASAGAFADERYPLNERVEYSGVRPDYVARDALRRLPYQPGSIRVESVDGPELYFARGHEEGPFEADQNVGDILSKLEEKVLYKFQDTAWGGCKVQVSAGLSKVPEIPDHMRYNSEDLLAWKSPALALEQYAQVIVFKDDSDGSPAFEPAQANVIYRGRDYPAQAGSTFRINYTGTDAEGAQKLAYQKALELGRGLFKNDEIILPYNPLLELSDVFTVFEKKREPGESGYFERDWLFYTDSYEQPWNFDEDDNDNGLETKPTCPVTLLSEQLVKAPSLILGLISGGILKTPRALYGLDGNDLYFDEPLTWVVVEGDDLVFYDDAPVVLTGDDLVVSR